MPGGDPDIAGTSVISGEGRLNTVFDPEYREPIGRSGCAGRGYGRQDGKR